LKPLNVISDIFLGSGRAKYINGVVLNVSGGIELFIFVSLKSPSIPLFQRGKLTSPPFGLWPGGKREAGRDFQSAKVLLTF
jgi:hypothetical protein